MRSLVLVWKSVLQFWPWKNVSSIFGWVTGGFAFNFDLDLDLDFD